MSSFSCSDTLGKMRGRSAKSVRCYKRDREPSRIPKQNLFHLLKHRQKRKQIKLVLKTQIRQLSITSTKHLKLGLQDTALKALFLVTTFAQS